MRVCCSAMLVLMLLAMPARAQSTTFEPIQEPQWKTFKGATAELDVDMATLHTAGALRTVELRIRTNTIRTAPQGRYDRIIGRGEVSCDSKTWRFATFANWLGQKLVTVSSDGTTWAPLSGPIGELILAAVCPLNPVLGLARVHNLPSGHLYIKCLIYICNDLATGVAIYVAIYRGGGHLYPWIGGQIDGQWVAKSKALWIKGADIDGHVSYSWGGYWPSKGGSQTGFG